MDRQTAEETLAKLSPAAREAWDSDDLAGAGPDIIAELGHHGLVESGWVFTERASDIADATRVRAPAEKLAERIAELQPMDEAITALAEFADETILDDYDVNVPEAQTIINEACQSINAIWQLCTMKLEGLGREEQQDEAA